MKKFLDLLERSVIVQGLITLMAIGAGLYLMCTGQEVPDLLGFIITSVLGFYFGTKAQNAIQRSK